MPQLRLALVDDVPAILEVVHRALPLMHAQGNTQWDAAYPTAEVFLKDVANKELWVAEEQGVMLGAAAITTEQYPEYASLGWNIDEPAIIVHRLVIDPEHRRKGAAVALMQHAEVVARERGIFVLRVDTNDQNPAAQKLFLKFNYIRLSGELRLDFRPGLVFIGYEKRLG
jgi:GNAT superfamily N-acetyltransferase